MAAIQIEARQSSRLVLGGGRIIHIKQEVDLKELKIKEHGSLSGSNKFLSDSSNKKNVDDIIMLNLS